MVEGDVLKPQTLRPALVGVEAAYYLIHSLGSGRDFEEQDRVAARNFGSVASIAPCDDSRAVSDAEAVEPMARS
ncbi:MAG: hypothetical protein KGJ40_02525 [candidate division NC10 bacterium]|nr:hypothetical protein [candidate division NC10 bacterium]